jgi:fructose-bisphosphate aldolase class 1
MSLKDLVETARALVANGKGLLAMDESTSTSSKRFAPLGIPRTPGCRRAALCQETVEEVADAAVNCLLRVVPAPVGGIAFLSVRAERIP